MEVAERRQWEKAEKTQELKGTHHTQGVQTPRCWEGAEKQTRTAHALVPAQAGASEATGQHQASWSSLAESKGVLPLGGATANRKPLWHQRDSLGWFLFLLAALPAHGYQGTLVTRGKGSLRV